MNFIRGHGRCSSGEAPKSGVRRRVRVSSALALLGLASTALVMLRLDDSPRRDAGTDVVADDTRSLPEALPSDVLRGGALAGSIATGPRARRRLLVSPTEIDIGDVRMSAESSATVDLRNAGTVPLHVAVTTRCGCVKARLVPEDGDLAVGASRQVVLSLRLDGRVGRFTEFVDIRSDDESHPNRRVEIRGVVTGGILVVRSGDVEPVLLGERCPSLSSCMDRRILRRGDRYRPTRGPTARRTTSRIDRARSRRCRITPTAASGTALGLS